MKFEEALKKLESIVEELETGSVDLDKAIKKYQEGIGCAKECLELLDKAEKKIQLCVKEKGGTIKLKAFKRKDTDSSEAE